MVRGWFLTAAACSWERILQHRGLNAGSEPVHWKGGPPPRRLGGSLAAGRQVGFHSRKRSAREASGLDPEEPHGFCQLWGCLRSACKILQGANASQ